MDQLTKDEQDIVFKMGRGCTKRTMNIRNPIEFCYALNVCVKQNDNEVRSKINVFCSSLKKSM